jgi:hypothetical protein
MWLSGDLDVMIPQWADLHLCMCSCEGVAFIQLPWRVAPDF